MRAASPSSSHPHVSPDPGRHAAPGSDSAATLREVERMILSVGGDNPAAALSSVQQQQRALATSATRAVAVKAAGGKDCLATDAKSPTSLAARGTQRSLAATPSMLRGASMAGKDRPEKRYIGKGFQPPSAESPGPIYRPPPGFVEESAIANSGFSFSKAPRNERTRPDSANNSATVTFATPSCLGKQPTSTMPTAATPAFGRASRFNEKIFLSMTHAKNMHATDTPGPAAYLEDVTRLPSTGPRAPAAIMLGNKEASRKVFISKHHITDSIGSATKNADFVANASAPNDSRFASSPAFSFGGATREAVEVPADLKITMKGLDSYRDKAGNKLSHEQKLAIQRQVHSERMAIAREAMTNAKQPTPGPGEYPVADHSTLGGPCAVFPAAGKTDKVFWSKELSTRKGQDSPGARYSPEYSQTLKHTPAATIAKPHDSEPHKEHDRFAQNQFIGKAFAAGLGAASPGPVYDPPSPPLSGPAYSMAGKEKHFPKTVFPGPSRPRWVSRESAKDNLGAYSPGPKYDTRTDFSKQGVAFSFGAAPRSNSNDASKAGRAGSSLGSHGRPPTVPPRSHSAELAAEGARGPVADRWHHITGPRIMPDRTVEVRRSSPPPGSTAASDAATLINPSHTLTEPTPARVGFTREPRFGPKLSVGQQGVAGPGPVYNVNHRLVEPRVPGTAFGGLP